ncbi:MAG: hypothetical protein ABIG46_08020 [Candidatus Omnitrophota bacterium]
MKYEKTKLNEDVLDKHFDSPDYKAYFPILEQTGVNKGGWGSTHNPQWVRESGIPIAYFMGFKEEDKFADAAGLAGYHSDFSRSITDFIKWKESYIDKYLNRSKLSNDIFIFGRYSPELGTIGNEIENEKNYTLERKFIYNCPFESSIEKDFSKIFDKEVNFQSLHLIKWLKDKNLVKNVDFVIYDNFKEDRIKSALNSLNKSLNIDFLGKDNESFTRYPHKLHEYLRNKNEFLFQK